MDKNKQRLEELWEQEMIDLGVARYERSVLRAKGSVEGSTVPGSESNTSYGVSMIKEYIGVIVTQLQHDIRTMKGRPGRKPIAWEYLSKLDLTTCAFISAKSVLDNISKPVKLSVLVNKIGTKIEDQTRLDVFKKQDSKYYRSTKTWVSENMKGASYRSTRNAYVNSAGRREDIIKKWVPWPVNDKIHIGTACLEAFIKVTSDYDDNKERIHGSGIIEKFIRTEYKKTIYIVKGTAKAAAWIRANQDICKFFYPDFMPTLIEPLPWTSPTQGGYHSKELQKRKPLVKMQQRKYLRSMAKRGYGSMPKFYDTVNNLQATPWTINLFVYNCTLAEFNAPNGIKMSPQEPYPEPPEPDFFIKQGNMTAKEYIVAKKANAAMWTFEQEAEFKDWMIEKQKWRARENERVSNVMQISRTLNMAQRLAYKDEFYFVWTADFRSRLYAVGTAVSPQGNEIAKALIKFRRGVELGDEGLWHLAIHAANVYGKDKLSLQERYDWILKHKQEIIDVYSNPMDHREFWGSADKPYLFLAACGELGECFELPEHLRSSYVSYIPCAQDGSCNGIQHYSAMLRDKVGAQAVNLQDEPTPSDIYNDCANKVKEFIEYSIANDVYYNGKEWTKAKGFHRELAEGWLKFGITRDCTKKPTMVIPYGGTKISCRDDCNLYLKDKTKKYQFDDPDYQNPFVSMSTYDDNYKPTNPEVEAITWLHHLVWHALDEVVVAARRAMTFLKQITRAVCSRPKKGKALEWTTPTGFRVYQEIKASKLYEVYTHLEGKLRLSLQKDIEEIDKRRMQTSIAPNFVHSMDSSHLQLVVTAGEDLGIQDFCVIHDSFGTHAGNTTMLHKIIRVTFLELHKNNLLIRFWIEQTKNNPEAINHLPNPDDVKQGEFNLNHVVNATYFFR